MKAFTSALLLLLFFAPSQQAQKAALLCHKWKQCGQKTGGEKYVALPKEMSSVAELYEFTGDGVYQNQLSIIKTKGTWAFDKTFKKLVLDLKELNGEAMAPNQIGGSKTTFSVIKLTKDTLILGKATGDMYFVRQDK